MKAKSGGNREKEKSVDMEEKLRRRKEKKETKIKIQEGNKERNTAWSDKLKEKAQSCFFYFPSAGGGSLLRTPASTLHLPDYQPEEQRKQHSHSLNF